MKKRILVLLVMVALMVVMLAMSVAPAFAAGWGPNGCKVGDDLVFVSDVPPNVADKDGKRTSDGFICAGRRLGGQFTHLSFYDNRPFEV
jgi:hypothetical protein